MYYLTSAQAYTLKQLTDSFKDSYRKHDHRDKDFNNRPFEPFHLFNSNYNPNDIPFITQEHINYYLPESRCYYCTGPWLIRHMECYNSKKCKMNFRYDYKDGRAIVETRQDSTHPLSIFMGRDLLVTNFFFNFPVIFRASLWSKSYVHHRNFDHFDDRFGNHTLPFNGVHAGTHSRIRKMEKDLKKIHKFKWKTKDPKDDRNKDLPIEGIIESGTKAYLKRNEEYFRLKAEIDKLNLNLVNSNQILELINYMKLHFSELIEEARSSQ